jgi:hypothetical protein
MYDTIRSSTSSKRSTIRCFMVLRPNKTVLAGVTANLSIEYLTINGQKSLDVTLVVKVCGSWLSSMAFHTKL